MLKEMLMTFGVTVLLTTAAAGQQPVPKPQSQPKPAESAPVPRPTDAGGQAVNVKLDLTITDQAGPGEPSKKVVTMIVADRQNGFIRTRGFQQRPGNPPREVIINVDAHPAIMRDGAVRVQLGLEYSPTAPAESGGPAAPSSDPGRSSLNERIVFMIDPGKPLIVSQAVDPLSDRRITVELTATIMK